MVRVHGFRPYFYIQAPPGFQPRHLEGFKQALNSAASIKGNDKNFVIDSVELESKQSLMNYHFDMLEPFIKIYTALPGMVPSAKSCVILLSISSMNLQINHQYLVEACMEGIRIPEFGHKSFLTYESDVLFVLRFMVDLNIVGGNWVEVLVSLNLLL